MNAYETGEQKVIPSVLLYAFRGDEVLMVRARGKDGLSGKWNGLGGKLEYGETALEAAVREFKEEASCDTNPSQWRRLGDLFFPDFKSKKREDWWVTVFITELEPAQTAAIPLQDDTSPEGPLHFVRTREVPSLDLWEGDRLFLPFVFEKKPFHGTLFYRDGKCFRHELSAIS